jgi:hypothetical protein
MEHSFRKLYQGQPGTSATTLYTVPGSTAVIIKAIRITNPTGTDRTIKLWHDGTADSNVILPAATVLAGGWAEFDGTILMEASDILSGQASAASALTVTVYGDELTL